jgi:TRAP-type C4-dicarboxylate transport system substrate-binding protein
MKSILVLSLLTLSLSANALTIKIAALAPEGTNWANTIKKFAKEVKKKTEGKVKFKVFLGGVQGDEPDVLRKVRVGQLHGGIFTGKTLGDIYGDIRAVEIPFNFYHDRAKAKSALDKMTPYFNKGLDTKGFVGLGFYELGNVYMVSTKEMKSIEQMKGIKIWAWEGDQLVEAMIKTVGLAPTPLALPDVLSSLSTGIVEAAYAPPLGILALQWQSKVKYLVDFPTAFSVGAMLISKKRWKKISPEHQKIVKDLAKKYVDKANEFAIKDNKDGLASMKSTGIQFLEFNKADLKKAEQMRNDVIAKVKGEVISEKAIKMLEQYR